MDLPENSLLPFFAYDLFKPGELGFIRLRPYIVDVLKDAEVEGVTSQVIGTTSFPDIRDHHWRPCITRRVGA